MIARPPFPWAKYDDMLQWCRVCGTSVLRADGDPGGEATRCERHPGRNPCAIDGCKRSTADKGKPSLDEYLCAEHWRLGCPPRSPERKAIRRLWRLSRRVTWTMALNRREARLWRWIVAKARSRAAGDIDMAEISRAMGWN